VTAGPLLPAEELGRVHFVGIGGAGMSGIARIMLARGLPVSGSDAKDSVTLAALRALGATVLRTDTSGAIAVTGDRPADLHAVVAAGI
jgi:UDP-N-acetylmuramate-alanine ligase